MALSFDLKVGDALSIDKGRVVVTLREKSGRAARVSVETEKSVQIEKIRSMTPAFVAARQGVKPTS